MHRFSSLDDLYAFLAGGPDDLPHLDVKEPRRFRVLDLHGWNGGLLRNLVSWQTKARAKDGNASIVAGMSLQEEGYELDYVLNYQGFIEEKEQRWLGWSTFESWELREIGAGKHLDPKAPIDRIFEARKALRDPLSNNPPLLLAVEYICRCVETYVGYRG